MKKKILIYAEIDWGFLEQRHHFVARHFRSQGYDVVFYQRVIGRFPSVKELTKLIFFKAGRVFYQGRANHAPRLSEFEGITLKRAYFLPPFNLMLKIYNFIYWFFFHEGVQRDAHVYSFSDNPWVVGNGRSAADSTIDLIHNWWCFPWHTTQHKKIVERCLQIYGKVICDSPIISDQLKDRGIQNRLVLPGVGDHWFSRPQLKQFAVPKPCFFGNLRGNSDLQLIDVVNLAFGLKIFGRIDSSAGLSDATLASELVSNSELPELVANYNIVLLPYNSDAFSKSISPAKYFEALATGALLVTRSDLFHLPGSNKFVFRWEPHWTESQFLTELNDRLRRQEMLELEQIDFAKQHTWKSRLAEIERYVID